MTALPSTFTIFENTYFSVLLFSSFLEFVVILTVFITFLGDERDFDAVLGCEMTARTRRPPVPLNPEIVLSVLLLFPTFEF